MAKKKTDNVTELPRSAPSVVIPDILRGIAGEFLLESLGAPARKKGGGGFVMDAHLVVAIDDDSTSGVQLPMEWNPYKALLKQAAAGGYKDERKRTLKAEGVIELDDYVDGNPTRIGGEGASVPCIVKSDKMVAAKKTSRYHVVVQLHLDTPELVARVVEALDCDVKARFLGKQVTVLKAEGEDAEAAK